jgi:ATP-dependent DNA ligase
MQLPVMPPVAPMLAKPVRAIPPGMSYEPKWDGFRSICFRDSGEIELGSRNERPMTRYFPELVAAVQAELPQRCVIDGEIVIATGNGLDFDALQQRIHPAASRVTMLSEKTPASFIAFDLHALGSAGRSVHLTPATTDLELAQRWFTEFEGAGLDGVIAKPLDGTYQPDKRVMFKIKHERTADCVLAGFRWHKTSTAEQPLLGSMLLGLYDDGHLQHVGVIGAFPAARRAQLINELEPLLLGDGEDHPWREWANAEAHTGGRRLPGAVSRWNATKDLSFVPLRPERVIEVKYEHMEGNRFRHLAHFVRWRPERDPHSCTYEQLEQPVTFKLGDIVPGLGATAGR